MHTVIRMSISNTVKQLSTVTVRVDPPGVDEPINLRK